MAQWDSAYENDLKDASFLWIEGGGSLDGEGKTYPRSLRHFPVRDKTGKVDPDHLRNALARIPQSGLDAKAKASATAHAEKLLEALSRGDGGVEPAAAVVERFDVGELRGVERTPQGGLRVGAYVTRTGILEYPRPDGSISRELRLPEDVFSADAVASMSNAPVTVLHPMRDGQPVVVDPSNWRQYSVGHVEPGSAQDGDKLASQIVIQDAAAIAQIESGALREVSLGYTCRLEETPGEWNGQPYDAIHRGMKTNHLSLGPVGWGRAGREVALRLNSKGAGMAAKIIKVDGIEYEFGSDSHIQAQQKWDTAREARIDSLTKVAEESRSALAAEQAARKRDQAEIPAQIRRRADIVATLATATKLRGRRFDAAAADAAATADPGSMIQELAKLMGINIDITGMTAEDVLFAVVKAKLVEAMADEGAEPPDPVDEQPMGAGGPGNPAQIGAGMTIEEMARQAMVERNRNAWRARSPHTDSDERDGEPVELSHSDAARAAMVARHRLASTRR